MKQNEPAPVVDLDLDLPADPDHRDLWYQIKFIKDNHLKHLHEDVDDVKRELKETRAEFNHKIDKLDGRIWALVILVTVTMLGVIAKVVVG